MPESFKVLIKELQSIGLDIKVLSEDAQEIVIKDDEEDLQCATIAGFLIVGTVPQLPEAGVPWTDFLTGKIPFGVLDFYVRESLSNVGRDNFYPQYDIQDDKLTMSVGQIETEEADNVI